MNLQSIPLILAAAAALSFCVAAALYYVLKKTRTFRSGGRRALGRMGAQDSESVERVLRVKRYEDTATPSVPAAPASSLKRILDTSEEKATATETSSKPRAKLPPPPKGRSEALAALSVDNDEPYLTEISAFQRQLFEAANVGELLNRTCRALSGFSGRARVVYLEYQAPQRALMVGSRSSPEIFAGTQPKMFLPLKGAGRSIAAEELRSLFALLPKDVELQRLLRDSCLIESRSKDLNEMRLGVDQGAWRIFPFYVRGMPQGAFALQENPSFQRREFANLVEIFLTLAASAVENLRLHSKMRDVAARDSVTGLHSRKVFEERLQENFLIARRLRHPLTVLRIDVDHMPAYVKKYGSSVPEALLRHVTRHLERHFRKSDVIACFGQNGFAIQLPHTALVDALKKVEQVLQAVRESSLKLGRHDTAIEIKASISAGVSEFPSHSDNPTDLLRVANEALFRSQGTFNGCVTLAKVEKGYVPPFNSRFVRSAPQVLQDTSASPILDS